MSIHTPKMTCLCEHQGFCKTFKTSQLIFSSQEGLAAFHVGEITFPCFATDLLKVALVVCSVVLQISSRSCSVEKDG